MTAAAIPRPAQAGAFRPLTALLLILAGVFSFSAYFVLSAYAPDLRGGGDDGGAHALSHSAVGFAGIVRMLQAEGVPVVISREGGAKPDPGWSLLVITPTETTKSDDLQAFTHGQPEPTLIVLPKWETAPDPAHAGWVQKAGLVDPDALKTLIAGEAAATIVRRADTETPTLSGVAPLPTSLATGPIAQLQTLDTGGLTAVVTDQSKEALVMLNAQTGTYILSDPDLLNTQGIKNLDTARAATSLIASLRQGAGPVAFDVTLNGFNHSPSPLKLAFEPPFLGATLCLAGAAFLIALHAFNRFGAPERTVRALALGKTALAENSAGLIRMAKREPHMAGGYFELNRNAVAKALGATRLSGAELDAYVDRLGERTGAGRLSALAEQTAAVKDRDGLLRFAQRLYQWRLEMTRERR